MAMRTAAPPPDALQAGPRVGESDAVMSRRRHEARAAVAHFDDERAVFSHRADVHPPDSPLRVHPVLDRVLDDRLQDHRRHQPGERIGRNVPFDAQPIGEPNPLNGNVVVEEFHLARQRNLFGVLLERRAEQSAQPADRLGDRRLVAFQRERRDRVQRIEQEVRVELCPQRRQARFGEVGAQVRIMKRQEHPDDRPVGQQVHIEQQPEGDEERDPEIEPVQRLGRHHDAKGRDDDQMHESEHGACEGVHDDALRAVPPLERKPAGQQHRAETERQQQQPRRQRPQKGRRPAVASRCVDVDRFHQPAGRGKSHHDEDRVGELPAPFGDGRIVVHRARFKHERAGTRREAGYSVILSLPCSPCPIYVVPAANHAHHRLRFHPRK
jgi:hypothetical protein